MAYARAANPEATVSVANALELPFDDGSMDTVFCSEVIEHLGDHVRGIAEMDRVLNTGGHMLLTFPIRAAFPLTRWLCLATDRLNERYYGKDHPQVHREDLDLAAVATRLRELGYEIVRSDRIKNTLATFVSEVFTISVKLAELGLFGRRTETFQLATQADYLDRLPVRLWHRLVMPVMRLLMRLDALLNGIDSTCGVILARKVTGK